MDRSLTTRRVAMSAALVAVVVGAGSLARSADGAVAEGAAESSVQPTGIADRAGDGAALSAALQGGRDRPAGGLLSAGG